MKVIFLDVDGVLNSVPYRKLIKDKRLQMTEIEREIDKKCLMNLKKIAEETGAKIVLTSSWRKLERRMQMLEEYMAREVGLRILDVTPNCGNVGRYRGEEIRLYLSEHQDEIEEFIILDDDTFRDFEDLKAHLIKTHMFETRGIEEKHVKEAIERLGRIKQIQDNER